MTKFHALTTDEIQQYEIDNQNAVRTFAAECIVMLENDGVLPLKATSNIALFGNGARHMIKGGTGSGDVNSRSLVNFEDGLKDAGFNVTTSSWLDRFDEVFIKNQEDYMAEIKRLAKEKDIPEIMVMFEKPIGIPAIPEITDKDIADASADTAVYVLSRDSGEGGDRNFKEGDYLLNKDEIAAITTVADKFKNTIVLLNVGGIINVETIKNIPGVNAIVHVSQLGNIGGLVVADMLLGKCEPSGRLTDTWAKRYEDYPGYKNFSHNNGDIEEEIYEEGIYIGYKYFDTFEVEPLYPFGYGLGYTTFDIKPVGASINGTVVSLDFEVTNTGSLSGKETVQVYVSAPFGKIDKPYQQLAGYKKTKLLAAGECDKVTVSFDIKSQVSYDEASAASVLEAGDYYIRAGKNSRSTVIAAVVTLDSDVVTIQHKNLFADDTKYDVLTNPNTKRQIASFNPDDEAQANASCKLVLNAKDIATKVVKYCDPKPVYEDKRSSEKLMFDDVKAGKATIEEFVAQLTVPEMAQLCVGAYHEGQVEDNVVGSASLLVPGAAAETTDLLLESRGIPVMILADGPAGIRLQPHFKATPDGKPLRGGEVFGLSFNPFPADTPADAIDYYQYCTAIPIATALAQTWNLDLIEQAGKIVGEEMKRFFVHFWLAPGMNIHRNPLCGRNFEYYSEDPLISGMCAAADTKGVQSFSGQGTTIKHFAGNNQEDNRMGSNSHITEKALRELYLKSFGIAITESQPYSIMTSYNMLNGIHTANSYELIQNVARDEFGFEGVIMTDWYTSQDDSFMSDPNEKRRFSSSVECIRAGNDWQMPGCQKNVTDIIEAVDNGKLSLGDLQFCVINIIKMAVKCFS